MGALLLCALLASDPSAARVDVSGGVAAELRIGRAPVNPIDPPELSFLTIVTPDVAMEARSRRGGTFSLGYSPRAQFRVPNRLGLQRPIFLHSFTSAYDVALSRRWLMGLNLGASVGEIDYTGINIALGDNASTPDIDVINFAFGNGALNFTNLVTPRDAVSFGPAFDILAPLPGNDDALSQSMLFTFIPTQTNAVFALSYAHQATSLDTVELSTRPGIADYNSDTTYFHADSRLGWERQLHTNLFSSLDAGVFAANLIRGQPGDADGDGQPDTGRTAVFPVGSAQLNGRLRSRASHWTDGTVGFEVIGFFDRVTSRVDPRGQLSLGVTTTIPTRWAVGVNASTYTALTARPRPPIGMSVTQVPETVIQGQTPITYTISDTMAVEFGTVVSVRASHLRAPSFGFTQLETWLYVAFRVAGGTARGGEEVAGRGAGSIGTGRQGIRALTQEQERR